MASDRRLALCVVLLLGVFAGCGNDQTAQPEPPADTTVATTTSTTAASTGTTAETTSTTRAGRGTGDNTCSAAGLSPDVPPQELPQPVAETRRAIVGAAIACDYQALADIAQRSIGGFNYSFGESGSPSEFWRNTEAGGEDVLRTLVEILRLPFAARTLHDTTQYVWPSAYAYADWGDVPAADREALLGVYSGDDLRRFEQFGSYSGYRVGIGGAGDWMFFVAGD